MGKRFAWWTIAAPTLVAGMVIGQCVPPEEPPPSTDECDIEAVHGTIRWVDASEWEVLNDTGHEPMGISSVELMSDRVRVHYTFTADKVLSLQATPDEAFASADVRVGASVAVSHADIYFYSPTYGSTPINPALLSKSGANVWLSGWFQRECED